jgi:integrase
MGKLNTVLNDNIKNAYLIAAQTEMPEYLKLTENTELPLIDQLKITNDVYQHTRKFGQCDKGKIHPKSLTAIQQAFRKSFEGHNLQIKLLELLLCIIEKELGLTAPPISQTCEIKQDLPLLKPDDFLLSRLQNKVYQLIENQSVLADYLESPKNHSAILILWFILKEGFSKSNDIKILLERNCTTYRIAEHWLVETKNRRVWISPMGELLLTAYWNDEEGQSINIMKPINRLLHSHRLLPSGYSLAFHHLRSMMKNEFILTVSPVEYSICQAVLPTTSLTQASLLRLLTGQRVVHNKETEEQRTMTVRQKVAWLSAGSISAEKLRKKTVLEQEELTTSEQIDVIEHYTDLLIKTSLAESVRISKALQDDLRPRLENNDMAKSAPWAWLVLSWMYHLLRFGGKYKKRLRLTTIKSYINYVAGPFIREFSGCDPKRMDSLDWAEKLNIVAEQIASTKKGYVLYFADFLIQSDLVTNLCLSDLDIPSIAHQVNANLITQHEADMIIEACERINSPTSKLAKLCFCFGFFSGLRRGEIGGLQFSDITYLGPHYCNLHVRPNRYRELKSSESSRNLPIESLWPSQHLEYLHKYLAVTKTKFTQAKSLIFKNSTELSQALSLLTEIMKTVTGEPELRFHHCRHSFCNWTWILLNYLDTETLSEYSFCQHEFFSQNHKEQLCQRLSITPFTRKKFWALSGLLGHSSPEVTTSSYFHLSEFVQRTKFSCHRPTPTLLRRYWGQRLTFDDQGRLKKIPDAKFPLLDVYPELYQPKMDTSDLEKAINQIMSDTKIELKQTVSLHEVWDIIQHAAEGVDENDIAFRLGIDLSTITSVLTTDREIAQSSLRRSKYSLKPLANYHKFNRGNHQALKILIELFEKSEQRGLIPTDFKYDVLCEILTDLVGANDSLIRTHNKNAALLTLRLMQLIGLTERHIKVKWYFPSDREFDLTKLNNYRKHLSFWRKAIKEIMFPQLKLEVIVPNNLMGHLKKNETFKITAGEMGKYLNYYPPGTISIHLLHNYLDRIHIDKDGEEVFTARRTRTFITFLRLIAVYSKIKRVQTDLNQ